MIYCLLLFSFCLLFAAETEVTIPKIAELWDYQNPQETEQVFRKLLEENTEIDQNYQLEIQTQIARTLGMQQKFEDGHAVLDQVESELEKSAPIVKMRYLLERGRLFNSAGNKEEAKQLFLVAYNFGEDHKLELLTLDAIHMMGIVVPLEEQNDWQIKALKIAENSHNEKLKGWIPPLYNNIGWTYHDLGEYENALEYFTKGYEVRTKMNDEQGARIAKWTIARTHRSLKNYEKALQMQKEIEKEIEEKKLDPDGYVMEEIAEIYYETDQAEKAKPYFAKAYEILSQDQWLKTNEANRLERLQKLSQ